MISAMLGKVVAVVMVGVAVGAMVLGASLAYREAKRRKRQKMVDDLYPHE